MRINSLNKLICLLISLQIASSKVGGCVSSANTSFCGVYKSNGLCNYRTGYCMCIESKVGSDCTGSATAGAVSGFTTWTSPIS